MYQYRYLKEQGIEVLKNGGKTVKVLRSGTAAAEADVKIRIPLEPSFLLGGGGKEPPGAPIFARM